MKDTYTKSSVYSFFEYYVDDEYRVPGSDYHLFEIDINVIIKKCLDSEQEFIKDWIHGYTANELAKKYGTYERDIYRKKWKIAEKVAGLVNGNE